MFGRQRRKLALNCLISLFGRTHSNEFLRKLNFGLNYRKLLQEVLLPKLYFIIKRVARCGTLLASLKIVFLKKAVKFVIVKQLCFYL